MKYFMVGAFATSVLLYGMALIYGAVGSTGLAEIGHLAPRVSQAPLFIVGFLLIIVALGFKIAAVPFHMWAPDAYEGAPTPVTAFMATTVKAAGFATLIRLVSTAFSRTELASPTVKRPFNERIVTPSRLVSRISRLIRS